MSAPLRRAAALLANLLESGARALRAYARELTVEERIAMLLDGRLNDRAAAELIASLSDDDRRTLRITAGILRELDAEDRGESEGVR